MNKKLKVLLNILIVAAAIAFLAGFFDMVSSISYKNREVEDPAQTYAGVFEYKLEHRAYGEIVSDYYSRRMDSFTAPAGYEDLYRVGEYAHTAFMTRVYDEKGETQKASLNRDKTDTLRNGLGAYKYTADEIDKMLSDY